MNMDDGWEFFVMGAIRGEMRGIWEEREIRKKGNNKFNKEIKTFRVINK